MTKILRLHFWVYNNIAVINENISWGCIYSPRFYIKFYLHDILNKLIIKGKILLLRNEWGKHV